MFFNLFMLCFSTLFSGINNKKCIKILLYDFLPPSKYYTFRNFSRVNIINRVFNQKLWKTLLKVWKSPSKAEFFVSTKFKQPYFYVNRPFSSSLYKLKQKVIN